MMFYTYISYLVTSLKASTICPKTNLCFSSLVVNSNIMQIGVQSPTNSLTAIGVNGNYWTVSGNTTNITLQSATLINDSFVDNSHYTLLLKNISGLYKQNFVVYFQTNISNYSDWTWIYKANTIETGVLQDFLNVTTATSIHTTSNTNANNYSFCTQGKEICVTGHNFHNNTVQLEMYTTVSGWAGLGSGIDMSNSNMWIIWSYDNKIVLSERKSSSHNEPSVSDITEITLITQTQNTVIYHLNASKFNLNQQQNWIWALGADNPESNDVKSNLNMHYSKGSFSVNMFVSGDKAVTILEKVPETIVLHGSLMFVSWNVVAPVAIFIAIFMKSQLGVWWFRAHISLFIFGTLLLQLVSFVYIYNYSTIHFNTIHKQLGLTIFVVSFFQVLLGFIIDKLWNPTRNHIPWWDQLHWWTGRMLMLLTVPTIVLGFIELETYSFNQNFIYTYIAYIIILVVVFIMSHKFLSRSH